MSIEYLDWDSNFFEKKIGRICFVDSENLIMELQKAKNAGFHLIYAFGDENSFVEDKILKQFNGKITDRKVLLRKKITHQQNELSIVSDYTSNELNAELENLAYLSGEYSRFKLDKQFQEHDFYRMYKIWIENSVKHKIANNVFVAKENEVIKGMVSLKIEAEKGHIGLLSVAPEAQGRGYGKSLIAICERELLCNGISLIEVPTQLDNHRAVGFYTKCGFNIEEITNIYHFWL
jgi:dTDP-4-amino-4,6-dideoxy-D-galactose acyltransferase